MPLIDDPITRDFKLADLIDASEVEIIVDARNKLWINVNGKCLLRIGRVHRLVLDNKGKFTD